MTDFLLNLGSMFAAVIVVTVLITMWSDRR